MSANQDGKGRQFVFDRCKQLQGARAELGLYLWYLLYCDICHFGFSHWFVTGREVCFLHPRYSDTVIGR